MEKQDLEQQKNEINKVENNTNIPIGLYVAMFIGVRVATAIYNLLKDKDFSSIIENEIAKNKKKEDKK